MDESIRTAAISPLRQRLIDDMNTRRFSPETQRNYIQDVGRFATFLGCSPDTATADDVRRFPRTASTGQHVARRPNDAYRSQKAAGPCGHLGNVLSVSTTFADN
jgi:hypothetical protein